MQKTISKKQAKEKERKLRQIQLKKEKIRRREDLYKELQQNQLKPEVAAILKQSGRIGMKESSKERNKKLELKTNINQNPENPQENTKTQESEDELSPFSDEDIQSNQQTTKSQLKTQQTQQPRSFFKEQSQIVEDGKWIRDTKKFLESLMNPNNNEESVQKNELVTQKKKKRQQLENVIEDDLQEKEIPLITEKTLPEYFNLTPEILKENRSQLQRPYLIQQERSELPIIFFESEISSMVINNGVCLISGETGCGKSTQVPQFLLEAGFAKQGQYKIGVTQPRRVAAVSLAKRVANEIGGKVGDKIGYQVRFQKSHESENTLVKFMTDGILLKEISSDFMLQKYSVIIIDEAHERTLHSDLLIGILLKIRQLRPLRIIIMSATLRLDDFKFLNAPSVHVPSRQFPVTVHHSKTSMFDKYYEAAFKKTCKIHQQLNEGGILVFLTGKEEIIMFCKELKEKFDDVSVKPLYSQLSPQKQQSIFKKIKPNKRLIVVTTNIAETSLTIPGIKYVVDTGLEKVRVFEGRGKIQSFQIQHISQASAEQRAGRAGRTAPGQCYRIYSQASFGNFEKFRKPEILRLPLDQIILTLKALGIPNIYNFQFLTKPDNEALQSGFLSLFELGLVKKTGQGDMYECTALGKQCSSLPLDPRIAKMLVLGINYKILNESILLSS